MRGARGTAGGGLAGPGGTGDPHRAAALSLAVRAAFRPAGAVISSSTGTGTGTGTGAGWASGRAEAWIRTVRGAGSSGRAVVPSARAVVPSRSGPVLRSRAGPTGPIPCRTWWAGSVPGPASGSVPDLVGRGSVPDL
ncbi:hypothetical protein GCM10010216_63040 [Streptomyces flaveolus]|nr:hypothetical protein GCM10010216_63040 [Streptomyces flaveolus]